MKKLDKTKEKLKAKTSIKSQFKAPKSKSAKRPKFTKNTPEKKKETADALCGHLKSQKLRDRCYKDKGISTNKMKANNKKRLVKAQEACKKVKNPTKRRQCQNDILKNGKSTIFAQESKSSAAKTTKAVSEAENSEETEENNNEETEAKKKIEQEIKQEVQKEQTKADSKEEENTEAEAKNESASGNEEETAKDGEEKSEETREEKPKHKKITKSRKLKQKSN